MKKLAFSLLIPLSLGASTVFSADQFSPASILPANTPYYLSIKDFSESRQAFQSTPLCQLLKDPTLAPLIEEKQKQLFGENYTEVVELLYSHLDGIKAITFACADLQTIRIGDAFQISTTPVLFLEYKSGQNPTEKPFYAEKIKRQTIKTDGNTEIEASVYDLKDLLPEKTSCSGQLWSVPVGENMQAVAYIDANSPLDTRYGRNVLGKLANHSYEKTLSNYPLFAEQEADSQNSVLSSWLDFTQLFAVVEEFVQIKDESYIPPKNAVEKLMSPPRPMDMYKALGLKALKSASVNVFIEDENETSSADCTIFSRILCPSEERRGLTALLDTIDAKNCLPDEYVPQNIATFQHIFLHVRDFLGVIDGTSTDFAGGIKTSMIGGVNALLDRSEEPLPIEENILDNLTGEIKSITFSENKALCPCILLGAKNPDGFIQTLLQAAKAINPKFEQQLQPKLKNIEGYVLVAPVQTENIDIVGNLSDKVKNPLLDSPTFEDSLEKLAENYSADWEQMAWFNYVNYRPILKHILMRKGEKNALPDYETIEEHIGTAMQAGFITRDELDIIVHIMAPQ